MSREIYLTEKDIERFWSKVDIRGEDECWEWRASLNQKGYGQFHPTRITSISAHRMAYIITYGYIDDEHDACHTCDRPSCCNPSHLFSGTSAENNADMRAKGRAFIPYGLNKGEINGQSILTDLKVSDIRHRYSNGESLESLALEFQVSTVTVWKAATKKTWRHIP